MTPNLGRRLMPSLMDRLTDADAAGYGVAVGYSEAQMRDAVKRDLADLLNAKLADAEVERDCPHPQRAGAAKQPLCYGTGRLEGPVCGNCCPELKTSLLAYGLPDLTAYDATNASQCEEIGRLIEDLIAQHEPRLTGVRVTVPRQAFDAITRELSFTVAATLVTDDASRMEFATVLQLISGEAKIDPPTTRKAT